MSGKSKIEWTRSDDGSMGRTWNPVRGCRRVSPGCERCYAERVAHRFSGPGRPYEGLTHLVGGRPQWTGEVRLVPEALDEPLHWRKPCRVSVNSMSDLFHEDVPDDFLLQVFDVMRRCTWAGGQNCGRIGGDGHTFQVLTKRAGRMRDFCSRLRWDGERVYLGDVGGPHLLRLNKGIWLGVSAEDQRWADERIPLLLQTPAAVRFVSAEPLLGPVTLWKYLSDCACGHGHGFTACPNTGGVARFCHVKDCPCPGLRPQLHWVIVGGESGKDARPMNLDWARSLVAQCREAGAACFVKQLGALAARELGSRDPKGGRMEDWSIDLQVREFPASTSV
jgi:protein gp37